MKVFGGLKKLVHPAKAGFDIANGSSKSFALHKKAIAEEKVL